MITMSILEEGVDEKMDLQMQIAVLRQEKELLNRELDRWKNEYEVQYEFATWHTRRNNAIANILRKNFKKFSSKDLPKEADDVIDTFVEYHQQYLENTAELMRIKSMSVWELIKYIWHNRK